MAKCDDRSWPPLTPSAATPTLVHGIKLNSTPGPLVVCEGNDGMYKSKVPLHPLDGPCPPVVSFHTLAKSDLPEFYAHGEVPHSVVWVVPVNVCTELGHGPT